MKEKERKAEKRREKGKIGEKRRKKERKTDRMNSKASHHIMSCPIEGRHVALSPSYALEVSRL